jgi:hypothetical protein
MMDILEPTTMAESTPDNSCLTVDMLNSIFQGSFVLPFNLLIYQLVPNLLVSVGHIAIPHYLLQ